MYICVFECDGSQIIKKGTVTGECEDYSCDRNVGREKSTHAVTR